MTAEEKLQGLRVHEDQGAGLFIVRNSHGKIVFTTSEQDVAYEIVARVSMSINSYSIASPEMELPFAEPSLPNQCSEMTLWARKY